MEKRQSKFRLVIVGSEHQSSMASGPHSEIPKPGDGLHICLLSYRLRTSLLFLWEQIQQWGWPCTLYGTHVSSEERSTYQVWIRGRSSQRNVPITSCEGSLFEKGTFWAQGTFLPGHVGVKRLHTWDCLSQEQVCQNHGIVGVSKLLLSGPDPQQAFVNELVLEQSLAIHFHVIYACFHGTM